MSVLLTDDAVRAVSSNERRCSANMARNSANAFVRYHATEGREALVDEVARALFYGFTGAWHTIRDEEREAEYREQAERVVAALFGSEEL